MCASAGAPGAAEGSAAGVVSPRKDCDGAEEGGGFGWSSSARPVGPGSNGAELLNALTDKLRSPSGKWPWKHPNRSSGIRRGSQGLAERGPNSGVSPRPRPHRACTWGTPGLAAGWLRVSQQQEGGAPSCRTSSLSFPGSGLGQRQLVAICGSPGLEAAAPASAEPHPSLSGVWGKGTVRAGVSHQMFHSVKALT